MYLAKNMGYAGANNMGVEHARGRAILLLNSDVMPSKNGWLDEMLETVGDSLDRSVTGARLIYETILCSMMECASLPLHS